METKKKEYGPSPNPPNDDPEENEPILVIPPSPEEVREYGREPFLGQNETEVESEPPEVVPPEPEEEKVEPGIGENDKEVKIKPSVVVSPAAEEKKEEPKKRVVKELTFDVNEGLSPDEVKNLFTGIPNPVVKKRKKIPRGVFIGLGLLILIILILWGKKIFQYAGDAYSHPLFWWVVGSTLFLIVLSVFVFSFFLKKRWQRVLYLIIASVVIITGLLLKNVAFTKKSTSPDNSVKNEELLARIDSLTFALGQKEMEIEALQKENSTLKKKKNQTTAGKSSTTQKPDSSAHYKAKLLAAQKAGRVQDAKIEALQKDLRLAKKPPAAIVGDPKDKELIEEHEKTIRRLNAVLNEKREQKDAYVLPARVRRYD